MSKKGKKVQKEKLRTALYARELSKVTIRATDPRDATVEICRYACAPMPAVGTHRIERGIYVIISNAPMAVDGLLGNVETTIANKDDWPDPNPNVLLLEPGASATSIREFFMIAKDISPDVKPAPRARTVRARG